MPPSPISTQSFRRHLLAIIPARERLGIAVSGGADSAALAHALHTLEDWPLTIIHVRHGWRSDDASNAKEVSSLSEALGLPCRVTPPPRVPPHTETAARTIRLNAYERVAREEDLSGILLGHHPSDSRETTALHVQRGHNSDRALCGIPPLRKLPGGAFLVRPYLLTKSTIRKEDLLNYCRQQSVPYRNDPLNFDLKVPRTIVRRLLQNDPTTSLIIDQIQRFARHRLETRLTQIAKILPQNLKKVGTGSALMTETFKQPTDNPREFAAEVLRLWGASLVRHPLLDLRHSLLDDFLQGVTRGQGNFSIPTAGAEVQIKIQRDLIHMPHEPLMDSPCSLSRILSAITRLPLYPDLRPQELRSEMPSFH